MIISCPKKLFKTVEVYYNVCEISDTQKCLGCSFHKPGKYFHQLFMRGLDEKLRQEGEFDMVTGVLE